MSEPVAGSTARPLRVVIADDVGFMRIALRHIIESDGDMRVVGEARDGEEAVSLTRELLPDVVTMDVEMPGMDGIEATRRIVAQVTPPPIVIMVSGHTQDGAAATIAALRAGAADFVSKQSAFAKTDLGRIDVELRARIRQLAERRGVAASLADWPVSAAGRPALARRPDGPVDLIAVGVSTGGPAALGTLLGALGPVPVPVVIAQHMPQFFTRYLAELLSRDTGLVVREGGHRDKLLPGEVMILPGARDGVVAPREGGGFELRLVPTEGTVHPSVDRLFDSAAMVARRPVAVILTGMGDDGARGAARFAQRDLPVLVQRPDSCVVGGMPSAALEAGVASEALALDEIAHRLRRWSSLEFKPADS